MSVLEDFETAVGAAQKVVDGITPEQLSLPSPCSQWDVRAVLNHLVFGTLMQAALVAGQTPPSDRSADYLGDDPQAAFLAAVDTARTAFSTPGALERIVRTPMGEQPASMLVHMRINELIAHGWDLAIATGQPTNLAPELAERALQGWRQRLGEKPRSGMPFDDEQPAPEDAPAADRLAAFLGRKVPNS